MSGRLQDVEKGTHPHEWSFRLQINEDSGTRKKCSLFYLRIFFGRPPFFPFLLLMADKTEASFLAHDSMLFL